MDVRFDAGCAGTNEGQRNLLYCLNSCPKERRCAGTCLRAINAQERGQQVFFPFHSGEYEPPTTHQLRDGGFGGPPGMLDWQDGYAFHGSGEPSLLQRQIDNASRRCVA